MKETTCPLCGKKISIADETTYKQHVLCPYCDGKFSYLVDSAEFSAERQAYAVATCQKNSVDSRYYNQAPAGARMYIGLLFYGKVFKEGMDANLYLAAMRKVEPQLNKRDWQYLLDNESDPELASYYKDRFDMARIGPSSAVTLHSSDYFKPDTSTVKAIAVPRKTIPATCPLCGEKITISGDVQDGQHVWCPYCDKKFDYRKDCIDTGDKTMDAVKGDVPSNTAKQTAKTVCRAKAGLYSSIQNVLARIKSRHDKKQKKRERRRSIIAKIAVFCVFVISLFGSIEAYRRYQINVDEERKAREAAVHALARYISNASHILSDYHSKYSISIQHWRNKQIGNAADTEKVRVWVEKADFIKSDIRRLLYDFNECGRSINSKSKSIQDIKFEHSDFEFRVDNLIKRIRQIGFDPPNADDLNKKPNPPKPSNVGIPGKSTAAPPTRPPAPTPPKPDMTKEDRMQAKVDELIEKLKRCNYPFDPDELKKEDLQTQLTMLQEMLYDVEMFQKKEQTPSH